LYTTQELMPPNPEALLKMANQASHRLEKEAPRFREILSFWMWDMLQQEAVYFTSDS
jgi:hypothetical protein